METLFHDLRYAVRSLRRSTGFTLVAVLTLALGIGATTAVFTVVDGVLLRPLAFAHEERLFGLTERAKGGSVRLPGLLLRPGCATSALARLRPGGRTNRSGERCHPRA